MTSDEVHRAQVLIKQVQSELKEANVRKMSHPRVYDEHKMLKGHRSYGNATMLFGRRAGNLNTTVPLPTEGDYRAVNDTVKTAAALLAEYSVAHMNPNSFPPSQLDQQASSYWLPGMIHGQSPFNPLAGYTVFRNVITDCGATGQGLVDDTAAIQNCISKQSRCGPNCGSTSVSGALIYFPAGTYLVRPPIFICGTKGVWLTIDRG